MARIIVTTDPIADHAAPVLMDERVYTIHLDNDHNAAQLIERLGWAISDAEKHPADRAGCPLRLVSIREPRSRLRRLANGVRGEIGWRARCRKAPLGAPERGAVE
jgi:hypothetical protein